MRSSWRELRPAADPLDAVLDEIDSFARRRVAVGISKHGAHIAEKVDQHEFGASAADLEAEEVGALGIERHRDGRLADLSAHRLHAQEKAFFLKFPHDDRNGLRRKSGHAGDVGLGQAAVLPDQGEHQALVAIAHAALVGATVELAFRRFRRTVPGAAGFHR